MDAKSSHRLLAKNQNFARDFYAFANKKFAVITDQYLLYSRMANYVSDLDEHEFVFTTTLHQLMLDLIKREDYAQIVEFFKVHEIDTATFLLLLHHNIPFKFARSAASYIEEPHFITLDQIYPYAFNILLFKKYYQQFHEKLKWVFAGHLILPTTTMHNSFSKFCVYDSAWCENWSEDMCELFVLVLDAFSGIEQPTIYQSIPYSIFAQVNTLNEMHVVMLHQILYTAIIKLKLFTTPHHDEKKFVARFHLSNVKRVCFGNLILPLHKHYIESSVAQKKLMNDFIYVPNDESSDQDSLTSPIDDSDDIDYNSLVSCISSPNY